MTLLRTRLVTNRVVCRANASSRKRVLETIAKTISNDNPGTSSTDILDGLLARERLGSTGIGEGVAIPHCRHATTDIQVCLLTTAAPVDYEASDGTAVDIFFALIVPHDEHNAHLRALADLSSILAEPENRECLRTCQDDTDLHEKMNALLALTETSEA
ncbi:MAG: PTS fructose transporter subunit IIA [Pseudomonadales bacterium]|nr:PTS fructose transporter subunit IIA [Pseudomonadales bacterium]